LRSTDLGFNRERLLTFETPLFRYTDVERRVAFIHAELEEVRAIPGVISAGAINVIPFTNFTNATFYLLEGQSRDRALSSLRSSSRSSSSSSLRSGTSTTSVRSGKVSFVNQRRNRFR